MVLGLLKNGAELIPQKKSRANEKMALGLLKNGAELISQKNPELIRKDYKIAPSSTPTPPHTPMTEVL